MDTLSRRRFLMASGVTGAAALAAGATMTSWDALMSRAQAAPAAAATAAAGNGTLVLVTLYGGNDGINTVIPYNDSAYRSARSELAYSANDVIRLDDHRALNPAMTGIHRLWQLGRVAIVRGAGYPKPDHSHFQSMDIWQTASPSNPVSTGWIGRWLDQTGDDPVRAVAIGSVLPPLSVGARCAAASLPVGKYMPVDAATAATITALGQADRNDDAAEAMARNAFRAERHVAGTFDPLLGKAASKKTYGKKGAGENPLAAQLGVVATGIRANVPTRVWSVGIGGFDTHSDEKGTQQALWQTVDEAITTFFNNLTANGAGDNVTMMVYSEFGRRVRANASDGTDHGTAGPVFVIGPRVNGGFHGEDPSLTDLDNGDLKVTVDFRAIYGEMLSGVLGTDPASVLDTVPNALGLLKA